MGIWSAIGSILGGPVGESLGAGYDSYSSEKSNYKSQKEFAQNAISWRVADAKRAGIHPLAALGNMGVAYQPFSVGGGEGQDVSRALMANMDARERREAGLLEMERLRRRDAMDAETHGLSMERGRLENELLRSQIARANSGQVGPGYPVGASPAGSVNRVPSRVVVGSSGAPERQPGSITEYQFSELGGGRYGVVPSEQMKERIEDSPMEWQWWFRNNLFPPDDVFRELERQHPSRQGYEWRYDPFMGRFWQRPLGGRSRHY